MERIRLFLLSAGIALMGMFEALAQSETQVKVDPGISVNNYKHPNKAAKAKAMKEMQTRRSYRSRVGIVRRSTNAPTVQAPHETPKYARRSGWLFFKRSSTPVTKLNPLTNPGNYKVNMVR